jgi:hypothetical protein
MNRRTPNKIQVFCGELCKSEKCDSSTLNLLHIDINEIVANIEIGYTKFVNNPELIPPRVLDLLQIAAYVFCADRMAHRGDRDSLNNETWARTFEFNIPVYDFTFWNSTNTKKALCTALEFMTGDRKYSFKFYKLNVDVIKDNNKQLSIFTNEYMTIDEATATDVMLFSGGLDSLAGAIQRLNEYPKRNLCLVSHKANNTVIGIQDKIAKFLNGKYNNRTRQYGFKCHNKSTLLSSKEETQRTRMFLFSAIAFAICNCYEKHEFYVYENGITSMNLAKQEDVINARASRTTHPKTLGLLRIFYKLFDKSFNIVAPYYNKTKVEVVEILNIYGEQDIITSSVSCSSTRKKPNLSPHCGVCSQCIDRRFAIEASGLEEDYTIYASDFVRESCDNETIQRLTNTLRLASMEEIKTEYNFLSKYADEVTNLIEFWPETNPDDKFNEIYTLVNTYGSYVLRAATKMRNKHDNIGIPINDKSLLGIINKRDHLKTPFAIRVSKINTVLQSAIPKMFQREKPKVENDFNDKLSAILSTHGKFAREYPVLEFGIANFRPDHSQDTLLIESKYIRGQSMTPSKATEDIAADITKAPSECGLLFVIYDPERKINDDILFVQSFECKRRNCFVRIYR